MSFYLGCAGWSLRREVADRFLGYGTHLARYAAQFKGVEINSTFYRSHRPTTYARWASCTPADFRFAVKCPKAITHGRRLNGVDEQVDRFVVEVENLGAKLGPMLVQLPPNLEFDEALAGDFFGPLRDRTAADIVCEPRHPSWFTPHAEQLLQAHRVARVAADPAIVPLAAVPGAWHEIHYYRLHGSPRRYHTSYEQNELEAIAQRLAASAASGARVWCIFDNTAMGAATENALTLRAMLAEVQVELSCGE